MKRNDLGFATKVWLTGVLIPSVFWVFTGDFVVWAIAIFYSAAFSIPSWLLLWLGVVFLNRQSWDVGIKKVVCCILSLPLTVGEFMLLKVNFGDDLFGLLNNFQLFFQKKSISFCHFSHEIHCILLI